MKRTIKGPFEVKTTPQPPDETSAKIGAMRMTFDKRYDGALDATGVVAMTGIMNQELGSGGYVAIEKVLGTIEGRKGSFHLQHGSVMNRGTPSQNITVIPDTGTEALAGLKGKMLVEITEGRHYYIFEYELP